MNKSGEECTVIRDVLLVTEQLFRLSSRISFCIICRILVQCNVCTVQNVWFSVCMHFTMCVYVHGSIMFGFAHMWVCGCHDHLLSNNKVSEAINAVCPTPVKDVRLIKDKSTNTSKGFCFVELSSLEVGNFLTVEGDVSEGGVGLITWGEGVCQCIVHLLLKFKPI